MLRSLRVNDFALIEDLVLGFGAGLNAVTGETGAGKSLLQRALAIAAGHRAGSEMVRAPVSIDVVVTPWKKLIRVSLQKRKSPA